MTDHVSLTVSVVLPCLNEEQAVGLVVEKAWRGIEALGEPGEVIVVDNGSTDRSAAIAAEHGARVVSEPRRGYGSAYLAGIAAARASFIVMADADDTYPVDDLRPFVARLRAGADMVIGSRFGGGIEKGAMPWAHRWIGNPALTAFLNLLFGVKVSDAHCGIRAVRRDVVERLELRTVGMEFASEMIVRAAKQGLAIEEVPVTYRVRRGSSKLNTVRDGWRHVRFLLVQSPTYLFLVPGLFLFLFGLAITLPLAAGPISLFGRRWQLHTMILGSTATIVGAQIIQLGIFARTYAVLYLGDRAPVFERLWKRVRLEHGLALGGVATLVGLIILVVVAVRWISHGFGPLGSSHESLLGLTLVGVGIQTLFGSFFLSILGLRENLRLDARPPAAPQDLLGAAHSSMGIEETVS